RWEPRRHVLRDVTSRHGELRVEEAPAAEPPAFEATRELDVRAIGTQRRGDGAAIGRHVLRGEVRVEGGPEDLLEPALLPEQAVEQGAREAAHVAVPFDGSERPRRVRLDRSADRSRDVERARRFADEL